MTTIVLICYGLTALTALGFGLTYLLTPTFMPYHAQAIGSDWATLEPELQVVILALIRVAGGGLSATAIAVLSILFGPFRQGQRWAYRVVPVLCLAVVLPTLSAVWTVQQQTPASPPLLIVLLNLVLILIAVGLSLRLGRLGGRTLR